MNHSAPGRKGVIHRVTPLASGFAGEAAVTV
jgi:hypothetical protein